MHVTELYELTRWIDSEIKSRRIVDRYQALQSMLGGQPQQAFENEKDALINSLAEVTFETLTKDQVAFLHHLGIASEVGGQGVRDVEDILFRNQLDRATAAQKLAEKIQRISQGLTKSSQIQAGLQGLEIPEETLRNEVLLRVEFAGDAAIANVVDFKKWGGVWFDIGRGITMVQGLRPQDVRIVGAKKGSVVLELALTSAAVAKLVAWIVQEALKIAERYLKILMQAEQIKALKLSNEKAEAELRKEAKKEKDDEVNMIVVGVFERLEKNRAGEGDQETALRKAINGLVGFLRKGGDIDFSVPQEDEGDSDEAEANIAELRQLRESINEIRKLEASIARLEYKPTDAEDLTPEDED